MTVSSTSSRNVLAGNGSTTQFPAGFRVDQPGDLMVIYADAGGNQTTLSAGQYTTDGAFGAAWPNGPTVTYLPIAGAIATGTTLTLERVISTTQPTSLSNQGAMWPQVIEAALDRIVMIVQGFIDGMSRALQIAPDDGTVLNPLPAAALRAKAYLGFDGNGQPTVLAAPSGSAPISPAMANVVDQSTLALARGQMGGIGVADSPSITGAFDFTTGRIKVPTRTAGDSGTDAASTAFVQETVRALTNVADQSLDEWDVLPLIEMLRKPENYNDRWIAEAATSAAAAHDIHFLKALSTGPAAPQRVLSIATTVANHYARGKSAEGISGLVVALSKAQPATAEAIVHGLTLGWPKDRSVSLDADAERAVDRRDAHPGDGQPIERPLGDGIGRGKGLERSEDVHGDHTRIDQHDDET